MAMRRPGGRDLCHLEADIGVYVSHFAGGGSAGGAMGGVDEHRRRRVAASIVAGYRSCPQTDDEMGWSDAATIAMIGDEPW